MIQTSKTALFKLTMILFFVFTFFSAKVTEGAALTILIKDCRDSNKSGYRTDIKVLKNGINFKILGWLENKHVLEDLELATYTLVYRTLFKKEERVEVVISENKKYDITLCSNFIDYSKEKYKPVIDRLKENETYSIFFTSDGCFHTTEDTIAIRRSNNIYTITCGVKSKELSPQDIEVIRHFEIELNYITDGGCTTIDTYVIEYNKKTKQIEDGSCRWRGFFYLEKQLFEE